MALQILIIWAKGPPSDNDDQAVKQALATAQSIFGTLTLDVWGEVNREEDGPLPSAVGYSEAQDYADVNSVKAVNLQHTRDLYLDASGRLDDPVYVLFIVPAGELKNCNGYSIRSGYCSVLPVPTGIPGTADGHTYAHEIGHGLSLPHVDDTANLMFPYRVVPPGILSGDGIAIDQYLAMGGFLKANLPLSKP
jgi:hypothetical protein